ncbi:MAG: thiamine-phosphate kinase [Burkholderiales bacterium]|nr:thiamine-phosphate kinase [Burkholderiales bacterium]
MSPEFDLITRHFARGDSSPAGGVLLGVGDDCALLRASDGRDLAVSTDTLVSGVHFFPDVDPARLGHKALAVNLSDLAAMGAKPSWFTLALTLPAVDHDWLSAFSRGLFALADEANIRLVGGDTTRGPLSMTLTVMGHVPHGAALRRDGARAGDEVWVSGTLGDAALGLASMQGRVVVDGAHRVFALDRLEQPTPRLALGMALRGLATSAIDISDGLLADLGHICERSSLSANIRNADLPLSQAMLSVGDAQLRARLALTGGDDYELCFTAPPSAHANIRKLGEVLQQPLTCIGVMREGSAVLVLDSDGREMALPASGFDHFSSASYGQP